MDLAECQDTYGTDLCASIYCLAALSLGLLGVGAYQYVLYYRTNGTWLCERQVVFVILILECTCMSVHYLAPWEWLSILYMLQEYLQILLFTAICRYFIKQVAITMQQPRLFKRLTRVLLGFTLLCATGLAIWILIQQCLSAGYDAYSCHNSAWLYVRGSEVLLAGLLLLIGLKVTAQLAELRYDRSLVIEERRQLDLW